MPALTGHPTEADAGHRRVIVRVLWLTLSLLMAPAALISTTWADAPRTASPPSADVAGDARAAPPVAGAVVATDVLIGGRKATAWSQGSAEFLLVEGEVTYRLGAYAFRASGAMVRLERETRGEQTVRHVAVYLADARPQFGDERAAVSAEAERLLVTGSTLGDIQLQVDRLDHADAAPDDALVAAGHERLARHDQARRAAFQQAAARAAAPELARGAPLASPLAAPPVGGLTLSAGARLAMQDADPPGEAEAPRSDNGLDEAATGPDEGLDEAAPAPAADRPAPGADPPAADGAPPSAASPDEPVLPTTGTVRFTADRVVFDREHDESVLMLIGNVRLIHEDAMQTRTVLLQAERAVVFFDPEAEDAAAAGAQFGAASVTGIYLEDNILITDGDYTLRAPRIFYDLAHDQAIVLDAVLYAWDVDRQIPLYLRADAVRQTSRTSFEASGALLTTSEFATPHLAVGANRVTLDLVEDRRGVTRQRFSASHTTLRVGDVPVFYWPYLVGETRDAPLRSIGVGRSVARGVEVETAWDVLALAGIEAPDGVEMTGRLDYRGRSGPGVGGELVYDLEGAHGHLQGYLLPIDSAYDRIAQRNRVDHDDATRGFIHFEHRQMLPDNWYADVEVGYVSDETFLESFFPAEAYAAKPYQTSLYLRKQEPEWAADLWLSSQLNDFTPQLAPLQSPGFQVERQPELGYFRTGTALLGDRLTWYSENRFSRVRAKFGRDTPADRGFREREALALFGIAPDVRFADVADASGFPRDWRLRLDTRQEITAPMAAGPIHVTPYAVGRLTAYDDEFEDFAGEDDQFRLWGSAGLRMSTQVHRSYDGVDSQLLNLNRLRHVIEPSIDLFFIGTTIEAGDLPEYDDEVEGIADGGGVRLGLRQTLQTQRGGPGRWRSVDWLTLQTDLVFRGRDGHRDRSPLARFYGYRPEYALGGDHFYGELLWMVSDTLGVTGEMTYAFHDARVAQWRVGASLQHTPRLSSFIQYRDTQPIDSRLLSYGFTYQLTTKYTFSLAHRLDLRENESRNIDLWLERRLPRARLRLLASFDQVDDEQIFGIVLTPEGLMGPDSPFGLGRGGW